MSFTTFDYSELSIDRKRASGGETIHISLKLTNCGTVAGDEVVQLYIHQRWGADTRPVRELKGFVRITLQPGETKTVTFQLGPAELGYWSTNAVKWVQEAEAFDIWVGADSLATLHADLIVVL